MNRVLHVLIWPAGRPQNHLQSVTGKDGIDGSNNTALQGWDVLSPW
jgi:hypothetical protein